MEDRAVAPDISMLRILGVFFGSNIAHHGDMFHYHDLKLCRAEMEIVFLF